MKVHKEQLLHLFLFSIFLCFLCFFSFCSLISLANEIDLYGSKTKFEQRFIFDTLPMNLEEITDSADRIFSGICTEIEEISTDPFAKVPVIRYTFKVVEKIKGIEKNEISFKQWKPTASDAGYEAGKKYILFLYPNSNIGLTSPVGFLQGHFSVDTDEITKEETVANKLGNFGLSRNLRTQKKISIKSDKELNDYIDQTSEHGYRIKYKEFIKTVKYLVEQQ